jgi:hypothetical protein
MEVSAREPFDCVLGGHGPGDGIAHVAGIDIRGAAG